MLLAIVAAFLGPVVAGKAGGHADVVGGDRVLVRQAGEPLIVAPTEGAQFTEITVSGSNCRSGTPSDVVGALTGPPGTGSAIEGTPFETAVATFGATPVDGSWTARFIVPPYVPGGEYQVRAICKRAANDPTGEEYQPHPFTVRGATPPTVSVSPTQARAGQELPLAVSGTLCPGTDVAVDVFARVPEEFAGADEFIARRTFPPDASGAWSGVVTIPATAGAGTYAVGASCQRSGSVLFLYRPVPEVVLSAAPIPAQPAFTG